MLRLWIAGLLLATSFALAQEESNIKVPSIEVSHYFPDNPFQSVVNGQPVDLLLGFRNFHSQPVRIVSMTGAFTQPNAFENIQRNMSRVKYFAQVEPNEETTVLFRFTTDFEPGEIGMVVKLEFIDPNDNGFAVTAFQGNLKVADPVIGWDIQTIFIYVATAAFFAGVAYLIYSVFIPKPIEQRRRSSDKGTVAGKSRGGAGYNEEWIPKQLLKNNAPKKRRG